MDNRADRRNWMEDQLRVLAPGIPFERKAAIKLGNFSEAMNHEEYRKFLLDRPVKNGIKSEVQVGNGFVVSVYLSHVTLYSDILAKHKYDHPDDLIVVLEDDVLLPDDWESSLLDAIRGVPDDWHIIRLGTWGLVRDEDLVAPRIYAARQPFWVPPTTAYYGGAHGVILRPRTLPDLLTGLLSTPLGDVDNMMTTCCDVLKSYVIFPSVVELNPEVESVSDNPNRLNNKQGVPLLANNDMNIESSAQTPVV